MVYALNDPPRLLGEGVELSVALARFRTHSVSADGVPEKIIEFEYGAMKRIGGLASDEGLPASRTADDVQPS